MNFSIPCDTTGGSLFSTLDRMEPETDEHMDIVEPEEDDEEDELGSLADIIDVDALSDSPAPVYFMDEGEIELRED